ncbi:hypothetical protein CDG77_34710 [Nostoc sp. 'Peltigera membranacea cyanobiont' 213]|uniref:hypothetical protein n=1 Tax=unclassified Nostoc TaxID=2593658 RepID=UPI000B95AF26|nr:hypothetical protein [Nostoc sp. 'Peltigera membranacea cyanobiont' 213]OYD86523.1 hypothetical protein CDG77_34710 [Nostoc sp. 'Peltigera membranacea cyanobiont' 213]
MLTYEKWLNCVFGSSVNQVLSSSRLNELDANTTFEFFYTTLLHSGSELLRFSDKQVNNGLYLMFSSSANIIYALKEPSISAQARTAAIRAIKILYTNCFEKRTRPVLSHLDEPGASSINSICYMLWDMTPINTWGNKGDCEYFELSLEVLEFALHLKNPACIESALHGLGHMGSFGSNHRIYRMIDDWIKQAQTSRPELLQYAAIAQQGYIL